MKKSNILISLLAVACLTGCGAGGNNNGGGSSQGGNEDPHKLVINDFGTVKFEAEDFDVTYWEPDESYEGEVIIENSFASGGKYLAAADINQGAEATFKFEIKERLKSCDFCGLRSNGKPKEHRY